MTGNQFKVNLFLLGAAKCGTTTLHDYLQNMPEVCMSKPKEPFFFECEFIKGPLYYQAKYFRHYNNQKIVGESRHRNLYLPYVAERIYNYNSEAKLLVILRNPTERAYSHWWHAYSRGYEKLSFELAVHADLERIGRNNKLERQEEITAYCSKVDNVTFYKTYVDTGYYYQQINRYLSFFKEDQLKVVFTDELERNPKKVISDIRKFLDLKVDESSSFEPIVSNQYKKPEAGEDLHKLVRKMQLHRLLPGELKQKIYQKYNKMMLRRKSISSTTRNMLIEHYKDHNNQLADFLQTDLSHWNS